MRGSITQRSRPPRLAAGLVRAILPRAHRAVQIAALGERFERRAVQKGPGAARRWYWRQALGFLLRVPIARLWDGPYAEQRDEAQAPSTTAVARGERMGAGAGGAHSTYPPQPVGAWLLRALGRDLIYALRGLRARPGFTIPALAILTLAVAANSAVLSVVDNVLLRALPYEDPDRLVMIWDAREGDTTGRGAVQYRHYLAWNDRTDLFAGVAAIETVTPAIGSGDYPARVHGMEASGNLFALLGVAAARGRALLPSDDVPGAAPVAVISDRLWRSHFGADPGIVGKTIAVNNRGATVVGVMPRDFWFYDPYMFSRSVGGRDTAQVDLWQPLHGRHSRGWASDDWNSYPALRVFVRLRDGVTLEAAQAAGSAMREALAADESRPDRRNRTAALVPLAEQVVGDMRPRLLLLQAAVTLVLLIACVNVMSLVLARAIATRTELAVRAALGAGRAALVRLAAVESALLGLFGGVAGLLLARSLGGVILRLAPRELPLAERVAVDARVALLTLMVAIGAGLLAGLVPILGLDFRSLTLALRSGSASVAGTVRGARLRFALVAVEVALTLVLLIGAAVLLRSFAGLWATDPGFDAPPALTFDVTLSTPAGEEPAYDFYSRLLDEVRELPGVEAAGATTHLPFSNWGMDRGVVVDEPATVDDARPVGYRWITEGYVEAMGMALVAGREFERRDDAGSELLVIVNEAFARQLLGLSEGAAAAVGRTIGVVQPGRAGGIVERRIAGVVGDVKHHYLLEEPRPTIYVPYLQEPTVWLRFVVRSAGDPLALTEPIRRSAAAIDPRQPLAEIYTLETLVAQSLSEERFYAQLLGAFGLVAFGLATAGVYGSVAYSARLRLREIGIRVAFGAAPAAVHRMIIRQGMAPVVVGILAGAAGATMLVRGLEALLHGISPLDAPSFVAAAAGFAAAAALAAWLPARRAARVDPVEILRAD
jgi:putative ABC transport system permease protein